jgi:hypothetical protein
VRGLKGRVAVVARASPGNIGGAATAGWLAEKGAAVVEAI